MGFILLWIECVAAGLFWMALLLAWTARRHWLIAALAVLPVLLAGLASVGLEAYFQFGLELGGSGLAYTASATLLLGIGAVVLWRRARRLAGGQRAALEWPKGLLLVAFGGAVAAVLMTVFNLDSAVKSEMALQRVEAGAMALSVAPPRIPDRENAALLYEQAFDLFKSERTLSPAMQKKEKAWHTQVTQPDLQTSDPDLVEYLKLNQPALELFRQASRRSDCFFEQDYSQPSIAWMLPELAKMRNGARLLVLSARVRAASGDGEGAWQDIATIFQMAQHTKRQPLLISLLVGLAIDSVGTSVLERLLPELPKANAELLASDSYFTPALFRAYRMEEASAISVMCGQNPPAIFGFFTETISSRQDYYNTSPGNSPSLFYRVFLLENDLAVYRRWTDDVLKKARSPYAEQEQEMKLDAIEARKGILTRLLMPVLSRTLEIATSADATHRLAYLALAMRAYQLKNGQFPSSLDQLVPQFVPAIPLDPFDGQPLRFAQSAKGPILYSIGPDQKDDQGRALDRAKPNEGGDLVFRLGVAAH